MSVNIMDLVKGAVSNQVMGQIGGLLGTDAKKTPSLFETAAGSILGGLMKKGSTAQGAQDIFGAVQQQDESILDKLGDLMGGGDATDQYQKQGFWHPRYGHGRITAVQRHDRYGGQGSWFGQRNRRQIDDDGGSDPDGRYRQTR